jgi:hypothetical protein
MLEVMKGVTPAAEVHGLWPWMNAPTFGRDVAPRGRQLGATGFAVGLHLKTSICLVLETPESDR